MDNFLAQLYQDEMTKQSSTELGNFFQAQPKSDLEEFLGLRKFAEDVSLPRALPKDEFENKKKVVESYVRDTLQSNPPSEDDSKKASHSNYDGPAKHAFVQLRDKLAELRGCKTGEFASPEAKQKAKILSDAMKSTKGMPHDQRKEVIGKISEKIKSAGKEGLLKRFTSALKNPAIPKLEKEIAANERGFHNLSEMAKRVKSENPRLANNMGLQASYRKMRAEHISKKLDELKRKQTRARVLTGVAAAPVLAVPTLLAVRSAKKSNRSPSIQSSQPLTEKTSSIKAKIASKAFKATRYATKELQKIAAEIAGQDIANASILGAAQDPRIVAEAMAAEQVKQERERMLMEALAEQVARQEEKRRIDTQGNIVPIEPVIPPQTAPEAPVRIV